MVQRTQCGSGDTVPKRNVESRNRKPVPIGPAATPAPKALLLDLGGVLLRYRPQAAFDCWAEAAGVPAASIARRWAVDDAYKALEIGAIDFPEYTRRLSDRLGIALSAEAWLRGWNAPIGRHYASVVRLLPGLAARLPLYCFSNTNAAHQAVWQPQLEALLGPVTKVYASWQLGIRKPDAGAYRKVVSSMGFAATEVLFIDDNRDNVAGARAAGLDARHTTGAAATVAILKAVGRGRAPSLAGGREPTPTRESG